MGKKKRNAGNSSPLSAAERDLHKKLKTIKQKLLKEIPEGCETFTSLPDQCFTLSPGIINKAKKTKCYNETLDDPSTTNTPQSNVQNTKDSLKNLSDSPKIPKYCHNSIWKIKFEKEAEKKRSKLDTAFQDQLSKKLAKLAGTGPHEKSFCYPETLHKNCIGLSLYHFVLSKKGGFRVIWTHEQWICPEELIPGVTIYEDVLVIKAIIGHDAQCNMITKLENQFLAKANPPKKIRLNVPSKPYYLGYPQFYIIESQKHLFKDLCCPVNANENLASIAFPNEGYVETYNVKEKLCQIIESSNLNNSISRLPLPKKREINILKDSLTNPVLIQGRPGTGKTLHAIWNMRIVFNDYWNAPERQFRVPMLPGGSRQDFSHLHQVFLTANPDLRKSCKSVFTEVKEKDLPPNIRAQFLKQNEISPMPHLPAHLRDDLPIYQYPLFLTTRQFIIMIDGTLENPFFPRDENSNLLFPSDIVAPQEKLVPEFNIDSIMSQKKSTSSKLASSEGHTEFKMQEIDFLYFDEIIWPEISKKQKTNLSSNLVWKEIYSYIKGTRYVSLTSNGCLTLEEYEKLGKDYAPNFYDGRGKIYEIFKEYQTFIKKRGNLFDWNDVVFNCIKNIRESKGYKGSVVHRITYDEVQDATELELFLLFLVIQDPNNLYITGDTCQTIERGVGFRFEDLRSIFHMFKKQNDKIIIPPVQSLTLNYRSFDTVIQLSNAVLYLLKNTFPSSFDEIQGEEASDCNFGYRPLVLLSKNVEEISLLMSGVASPKTQVRFGANQIILVRDEVAKNSLPDVLKQSQCATIFESKGLEYDDIILYNFFNKDKEWKTVFKKPNSCPSFLCDELKLLFVAINRAKKNVWFVQTSYSGTMPPMIQYFDKNQLIDIINDGDVQEYLKTHEATGGIAKESTASEWEEAGNLLLQQKNWKAAATCFENAGASKRVRYVESIRLQQSTRLNPKQAEKIHLEVAQTFVELGNYEEAAASLYAIGNINLALNCSRLTTRHDFSAFLYQELCEWESAVYMWFRCPNSQIALEILANSKCFTLILQYLPRLMRQNKISLRDVLCACNLYNCPDIIKLLLHCNPVDDNSIHFGDLFELLQADSVSLCKFSDDDVEIFAKNEKLLKYLIDNGDAASILREKLKSVCEEILKTRNFLFAFQLSKHLPNQKQTFEIFREGLVLLDGKQISTADALQIHSRIDDIGMMDYRIVLLTLFVQFLRTCSDGDDEKTKLLIQSRGRLEKIFLKEEISTYHQPIIIFLQEMSLDWSFLDKVELNIESVAVKNLETCAAVAMRVVVEIIPRLLKFEKRVCFWVPGISDVDLEEKCKKLISFILCQPLWKSFVQSNSSIPVRCSPKFLYQCIQIYEARKSLAKQISTFNKQFEKIRKEFSALIVDEVPLATNSEIFACLFLSDSGSEDSWDCSRRWEFCKEAEALWNPEDIEKTILLSNYLSHVGTSFCQQCVEKDIIALCAENKKILLGSKYALQLLELCVLQLLRSRYKNNTGKRNPVVVTRRMKLQFLRNAENISEIVLPNKNVFTRDLRRVRQIIVDYTKTREKLQGDLAVIKTILLMGIPKDSRNSNLKGFECVYEPNLLHKFPVINIYKQE